MDGSGVIILTGSTRGKSDFLSLVFCISTLPLKCAPSAIEILGGLNIPHDGSRGLDLDNVAGVDVADDAADDRYVLGIDLGIDLSVGPNDEVVIFELNLPFNTTFYGEVFITRQLPFDENGFPMLMTSSLPGLGLGSNRHSIGFFSSNAFIGTSSFRGA